MKNSFIINKKDINFAQTLKCGQIFSYMENDKGFTVFSGKEKAEIIEKDDKYEVITNNIPYFENFFDLKTDYNKIKNQLSKFKVMDKPIKFGEGIRILRQDILETIISFVISANNRIPRIQKSVFYLRAKFGENMGSYHAFPNLEQLSLLTEKDFLDAGLGYRAKQMVKLITQLQNINFLDWKNLETEELQKKLINLSGVGPKVADCVMLFGYAKSDVFPVDTWIEKVFNQYFFKCSNRKKIREYLVSEFKNLSGYAQQYLFFYQREMKN